MYKAIVAVVSLAALATPFSASADEALAKSKACLACHQIERKVVGPAYKDVAARYKGQADARETLIGRVKNGGKGSWGPIPMPKQNVTDEEAAKLVDWILAM